MSVEQNKKAAIDVLNAINVGDTEAFARLVDDECKWWVMGGEGATIVDKPTVMKLTKIIHDGADTPFNFKYGDITAENDRVLVEAWGDMTMKTGGHYKNVYVFKMQFKNGKVIAAREFFDTKILDEHLTPLFAKSA